MIVASVVPDIMHSFTSGIIKYLGTEPMIVSSQTDTGVRVVTENPTRTGPDRIVNAAAGYAIAGGPAIVVDFGTATTYDLIGPECTLEACVLAPGRRFRSEDRNPCLHRRRLAECRQDLYTERSDRRNI